MKEYYMALDKYGQDTDYQAQLKVEQEKVDKEMEEDEQQEDIPEGLTKVLAEQLLEEKEKALQNICK